MQTNILASVTWGVLENENEKLDMKIDDKNIERVSCFKFLGLTFKEFVNCSSHSADIANKICRTSGIVNRLKRYLPFSATKLMCVSLSLSHLQFGLLGVWVE